MRVFLRLLPVILAVSLAPWATADEPAVESPAETHEAPPRPIGSPRLEVAPKEELSRETWTMAREIHIQGIVQKDIFFQCTTAQLDGIFKGDVWGAASSSLSFRGDALDDMRLFSAGSATLDGRINGNLLLRAESLQLGTNSVIRGDATLNAGALVQDGIIEGKFEASVRDTVTIKGEIRGDVILRANEITLMPNAHIRGNLLYESKSEPMLSPGARVDGEIRREAGKETPFTAILAVLLFVSYTGFGLMVSGILPRTLGNVTSVLGRLKIASLFNGGVAAVVLVFLTTLLLSSSLATFLGLLLIALLLVIDGFGLTAAALAIASLLLPTRVISRPIGRVLAIALGMAIIHTLLLLPTLGSLLLLLLHLAGIGSVFVYAVTTQRLHRISQPLSPPSQPIP